MDVRMLVGALEDFDGNMPVLIEDENGERRYATISDGFVSGGVPVVIISGAGPVIVHQDDLDESDTDD